MVNKKKRGRRKRAGAKAKQESKKQEPDKSRQWYMTFTAFFFDTAYDLVTWIVIALSVGFLIAFFFKGSWRGVMWASVVLISASLVMVAIRADKFLFRSSKPTGEAAPKPEPSGPTSQADRASIAIKSARLTIFEVNKKTEALITFINSGGMAATNVRVYGHIQLRDKPIPPEMPGAKDIGEEPSQDVMPANGGISHMPISSGSVLTREFSDLIDRGKYRIYIWGIATYEDALGERWTKFCLIQYGKSMNLENCTNNNETDK
jgi:hypothetical protein